MSHIHTWHASFILELLLVSHVTHLWLLSHVTHSCHTSTSDMHHSYLNYYSWVTSHFIITESRYTFMSHIHKSCIWHESFIHVPWLIGVSHDTRYAWDDSFIFVPWLSRDIHVWYIHIWYTYIYTYQMHIYIHIYIYIYHIHNDSNDSWPMTLWRYTCTIYIYIIHIYIYISYI